MRAPIAATAAAAAVALASCGGPLFSAEVEVQRFCFTQSPLSIPFAPAPLPAGTQLTVGPVPVTFQLPPLLTTKGTLTVRLDEVTLAALTPGVDLSGITELRIEENGVLLAVYTRPAGLTGPLTAITAQGQGVDVAAAAQSKTLQVTILAAGDPPVGSGSWNGAIQLCAYGKSVIPYF